MISDAWLWAWFWALVAAVILAVVFCLWSNANANGQEQTKRIQACVNSGGDWINVNKQSYPVLGCVHREAN